MRPSVAGFLLINFVIISYAVASVWTLLSLLVVDGSADVIPFGELTNTETSSSSPHKELIPRIIHQTYIDEPSIPDHWNLARRSCLALHTPEDGWEYKLWTDKAGRDFVASEYSWFLNTFDGYKYPIQRADAIRYLALAHYGGIYIDLDDGCNRKLDPLLAYPAWLRRAAPTGISNDVMGCIPHHPFFAKVVNMLPRYNKNWLLPYVTVMASTGPLFLSLIWRHYNDELASLRLASIRGNIASLAIEQDGNGTQCVRILALSQYMGNESSFFSLYQGSSWHKGDARLVFWMHEHWIFLLLLSLTVAYIVITRSRGVYKCIIRRCRGVFVSMLKNDSAV